MTSLSVYISGTCPIVLSWFTVMCSCAKLPPLCSNWKTVVEVHAGLSLNVPHSTQERWRPHQGLGSFPSHKNKISESAVRWDLRFFVLSEKTKKSNRLQMSLQRQHFLLIFYFKSQLFKDPECWSGQGLNPRTPVQQTGGRRSQQRATAWVVYTLVCKEASSSFRLKREVYREEKGMLATDQTWFLATLNEDRFLCLWEITYCRMCGCFQRFNLEALS